MQTIKEFVLTYSFRGKSPQWQGSKQAWQPKEEDKRSRHNHTHKAESELEVERDF